MSELAKFTMHIDPGHGWLEVTRAQLVSVGLKPDHFSPYSYWQRWGGQDIFYLEQDEDAAIFVVAYMEKHTKMPHVEELSTNQDHYIKKMDSLAMKWGFHV